MNLLDRIRKPWFMHHPKRLVSAARVELGLLRPGWHEVNTCFGAKLICDTSKAMGRSLYKTGVHELATSEMLWRLLSDMPPGSKFVDVGANIGYFCALARAAAGSSARIVAFEPVPVLFDRLRYNTHSLGVEAHQVAVSSQPGTATLFVPDDSSNNDGLASLESFNGLARRLEVATTTLDEQFDEPIHVLKLDIEGHEADALRGARHLLQNARIESIVFEDHPARGSGLVAELVDAGFAVRGLGWDYHGLVLCPPDQPAPTPLSDAPVFIASRASHRLELANAPGWRVLGQV